MQKLWMPRECDTLKLRMRRKKGGSLSENRAWEGFGLHEALADTSSAGIVNSRPCERSRKISKLRWFSSDSEVQNVDIIQILSICE